MMRVTCSFPVVSTSDDPLSELPTDAQQQIRMYDNPAERRVYAADSTVVVLLDLRDADAVMFANKIAADGGTINGAHHI